MKFRTAGATAAGSAHLSRGAGCQDMILTRESEGYCLAVLADGAGSKKYAAESAKLCCAVAAEILSGRAMTAEEAGSALCGRILEIFSMNGGLSTSDLGATLLFVYLLESGKYIAGHVGDGAIFAGSGGCWRVLSAPENGEYINETYFVPEDIPAHLRLYAGTVAPGDSFILTSDGISDMLYDPDTGETMRACGLFEAILNDNESGKAAEIYQNELDTFFRRYTADDMSVAVIKAF